MLGRKSEGIVEGTPKVPREIFLEKSLGQYLKEFQEESLVKTREEYQEMS